MTGAGAAIGRETAPRFGAEGAKVAVFEHDEMAGKSIAETITTAGGVAPAVPMYQRASNKFATVHPLAPATEG